jgi:hypothetical protein
MHDAGTLEEIRGSDAIVEPIAIDRSTAIARSGAFAWPIAVEGDQ